MDPHTFSDKALAMMTDHLSEFRGATTAREKKDIVKAVWRKLVDVERGSMAPLDLVEAEKVVQLNYLFYISHHSREFEIGSPMLMPRAPRSLPRRRLKRSPRERHGARIGRTWWLVR